MIVKGMYKAAKSNPLKMSPEDVRKRNKSNEAFMKKHKFPARMMAKVKKNGKTNLRAAQNRANVAQIYRNARTQPQRQNSGLNGSVQKSKGWFSKLGF